MAKRGGSWRDYFLLNMNVVVRVMVIGDVIFMSGIGLLGPIFAIFIVDFIEGGSAAVAGVAAAIYLVTKSLLQVPIATLMDRIKGERDDFLLLIIGSGIASLVPLTYLFIRTPLQLYITQFLYGAVLAMAFPSFMAIYTRHISRQREGAAWGLYYTFTDLSAAVVATLGGVLADTVGFRPLFILASLLGIAGTALTYMIRPYLQVPRRPRQRRTRGR